VEISRMSVKLRRRIYLAIVTEQINNPVLYKTNHFGLASDGTYLYEKNSNGAWIPASIATIERYAETVKVKRQEAA